MNQTLIFYEFLDDVIYDFREIKTVWIKQSRSDWKKRCVTLMIYVSSDDLMHCKSLLIFKDLDKHVFIKKKMQKYHKNVVVQWNKKTYCNTKIMLYWLQHMYRLITLDRLQTKSSRLLSLDVFVDQKTSQIKQIFKNLNVISFFISFDCIDYVQVFDVVINKSLKMMLTNAVERHYSDNFDKWQNNTYIVDDRRTMLTQWIDEIWTRLHKEKRHVIRDTFRKLDLSLIVDDFEDHELNVKDINDLKVENWRLSASTIENVYNSLNSTEKRRQEREKTVNNSVNEYVHDTENLSLQNENDELVDAEDVTDSKVSFDSSSEKNDVM